MAGGTAEIPLARNFAAGFFAALAWMTFRDCSPSWPGYPALWGSSFAAGVFGFCVCSPRLMWGRLGMALSVGLFVFSWVQSNYGGGGLLTAINIRESVIAAAFAAAAVFFVPPFGPSRSKASPHTGETRERS